MNHSLVFVLGPPRVGKSTVGKLLAETLGIPFEEISLFNQEALAGSGFEQKVMEQTWASSGFEGLIRYIQSFQPYVLRAFLAKHTNGVVELDSSMMAAVDPRIRSDIAEILNPYPRILLLPEPN